jgi:hypothetical protein
MGRNGEPQYEGLDNIGEGKILLIKEEHFILVFKICRLAPDRNSSPPYSLGYALPIP